jgi:hypothetical protein
VKKWFLLYGFVNIFLIFCLVLIFFWVGEPLSPLDRTNNPMFLAYFLHLSTFWFLTQAISLTIFWNQSIATNFPKWITYLFWFFGLSFFGFSLFDTYASYFRSGFWVTWIRVLSDQQQMHLLIQKGFTPFLFLLPLILLFTISLFIQVFKKNKPNQYILPLFFTIIFFIALLVSCLGLILFRDSFFIHAQRDYNLSQMSEILPFLFFGRAVLYLLTSIYLIYQAFILDN